MTAKTGARLHGWTMKDRRRYVDYRFGSRSRCDWGAGDLPAPWAEGDIVSVPELNDRMTGMVPGYMLVTYCPSIDEGDGWFVRLMDVEGNRSERLHVAYEGRHQPAGWASPNPDFTAGITLVETADPDGLVERERLLAAGWSYTDTLCPRCGGSGRIEEL